MMELVLRVLCVGGGGGGGGGGSHLLFIERVSNWHSGYTKNARSTYCREEVAENSESYFISKMRENFMKGRA